MEDKFTDAWIKYCEHGLNLRLGSRIPEYLSLPLFIFIMYTNNLIGLIYVNGHTKLKTPGLVQLLNLSKIGPG